MSWKAVPGKLYRARVILDDEFNLATTELIVGELQEQGFTDVEVWWEEDELPGDWPADRKSDESDLFERQVWMHGVWSGPESDQPESGDDWRLLDLWEVAETKQGPIVETEPTRWKSAAAWFGGGALAGILVYWLVKE